MCPTPLRRSLDGDSDVTDTGRCLPAVPFDYSQCLSEESADGLPPMIPYEPCSDSEDDDYIPIPDKPRLTEHGWSAECLQDDAEDIDFEFVYALHTFVATVEGQANATKGDTMVLLDDSNSYWWLVRVVKDSSIGEMAGVVSE